MSTVSNAPADGFKIGPNQTLVCLGDSITQNSVGYCPMIAALIAASYPDRNIRVVNAGIGGNKIPDLLARLDRDVLSHRPDWVTVSVGINDVWHGLNDGGKSGVPLGTYREGLAELTDRLVASGANVVLLPPTVIGEDLSSAGNVALRDYRAAVHAIAASRGLLIAPTDTDLDTALVANLPTVGGEPGKTLTSDGVHLRPAGDAVLAAAVLKTLGFFSGGAR
ncbi:MAG: SGNH/GDSL hydrolase family protein [Cytophagales bacterium]|nr:SGNH/GDSL hydrolase family protein [Armatimonadota bacterium]